MRLLVGRALAVAALVALPSAALAQHPAPPAAARAQTVRPEAEESLQWAASVVQLDPLHRQGNVGGKLFGTAGGDPAMNGLDTHLAFYLSPADGWRVFRIGDFLSYRLLSEAPGRLVLALSESVMNQRTGTIGSRTRRLAVSWTVRGDAAPATISLSALP